MGPTARTRAQGLGFAGTLLLGLVDLGVIAFVIAPRLGSTDPAAGRDAGPAGGPRPLAIAGARRAAGPDGASGGLPVAKASAAPESTAPAAETETETETAKPEPPAETETKTETETETETEETAAEPEPAGPEPVLEPIYFASGSTTLDRTARRLLRAVAAYMRDRPELRLAARGHADPRGHPEHNLRLSGRRAAAVAAYLRRKGVARERVAVGAAGAAGARDGPAGWRLERRVELGWVW